MAHLSVGRPANVVRVCARNVSQRIIKSYYRVDNSKPDRYRDLSVREREISLGLVRKRTPRQHASRSGRDTAATLGRTALALGPVLDLVHKDTDSETRLVDRAGTDGGSGGTRLNFHEYALERHAADQSPEWRAKIQRGVTIRGTKFPSPAVLIGTGLRKSFLDLRGCGAGSCHYLSMSGPQNPAGTRD